MIELAGLIAALALLLTLILLEVRRTGADSEDHPGHHARPKLLGRTLTRGAVAVLWAMYALLFLPRVLGLLA
jgi:hypothetical protein